MKKKIEEVKVGEVFVSRETGTIGLLTEYDLGKRKFTLEVGQGWMTLTYRQGLTLEQAVAIEYDKVGKI